MSRHISTATMEQRYGMPRATQKIWRMSGRFVRGRDYIQDGNAILYDTRALERHKELKKYIKEKK